MYNLMRLLNTMTKKSVLLVIINDLGGVPVSKGRGTYTTMNTSSQQFSF